MILQATQRQPIALAQWLSKSSCTTLKLCLVLETCFSVPAKEVLADYGNIGRTTAQRDSHRGCRCAISPAFPTLHRFSCAGDVVAHGARMVKGAAALAHVGQANTSCEVGSCVVCRLPFIITHTNTVALLTAGGQRATITSIATSWLRHEQPLNHRSHLSRSS
ncbi:hypothetical protein L209DRAFT_339440 [Thermothelomyces heterothallicus CBS 203.75]